MFENDGFDGFDEFNKEIMKKLQDMFNFNGFINFDNFNDMFNDSEDPNNPNKGYSISYRFGTGMDKPEFEIKGNLSEEEMNRIREQLEKMNINFGFNFIPAMSQPKDAKVIDFKEVNDLLEKEENPFDAAKKSGSESRNKADNKKAERSMKINRSEKPIEEPYTDVIETENEIKIILELPGVDKKDVQIALDKDDKRTLIIRAETNRVIYEKAVKLSKEINLKKLKGKSTNGIFQITISK